MTSKRKHVTLDLRQKLEVLDKLNRGSSQKAIAAEYNVGRATIYDIKKKEDVIRQYASQMESELGQRKAMRKSENEELDAAVYRWFIQQRSKGIPISGPIIKQKAVTFNKQLGGSNLFAASEGWLSNWKKRHGVRQLTVTGESRSANEKDAEEFIKKIGKIIKEEDLTADALYNADETGLFYKMLPSKTLAAKNEKQARGYKQQKQRVTLMACCNANGSHKLPLMVIGKSQNPRCFRHSDRNTLPVQYSAQKKAWMDRKIFSQWFHETFVPAVRKELKKKKLPLKAILIIDNAPSHPSDVILSSDGIQALFLPPNVTALIQPMDQGILESIKRHYRHALLVSLLNECENDSMEAMLKVWKAINLRDVVFQTAEAWNKVENATITKSWRKMWPSIDAELEPVLCISDEPVNSESSTALYIDMLHKLPGGGDIDEDDVAKWLNEERCEVDQILTDEEIIKCVQQSNDESDEEEDVGGDSMKISHTAGAEAADIFLEYIMQQPDTCSTDVMLVKRLRDKACRRRVSSLRQLKIQDIFNTSE